MTSRALSSPRSALYEQGSSEFAGGGKCGHGYSHKMQYGSFELFDERRILEEVALAARSLDDAGRVYIRLGHLSRPRK